MEQYLKICIISLVFYKSGSYVRTTLPRERVFFASLGDFRTRRFGFGTCTTLAPPMSLPKARISANYIIVKRNIAMHWYAF